MSSDSKDPIIFTHGQTMLVSTGHQCVNIGPKPIDKERLYKENQQRHHTTHPEVCIEDATYFYKKVTPAIDKFVPSYLEAQPLKESVGARRNDDTYPPWVVHGDPNKTPCEQYVEWFNYIWNTGDPSQWDATVFTNNCVTIDPTGMTTGAEESALNFIMLFRYFPELRGEVVSWAVNDRELLINWRFRVPNKGKDKLSIGPITQTLQEQQGGRDFLVPVIDKFCFVDGRVSFRAAYFDIVTFTSYLSQNLSANQLYDYLIAWTWKSLTSGGVPFLLKRFVSLFLGLFVWPPEPEPTGLVAFVSDGQVTLRWPQVTDAVSYRLCRAAAIEGPYEALPRGGSVEEQQLVGTSYTDDEVIDGTPYWYTIAPNFSSRRHAPITQSLEIAEARESSL